MLSRKAAREQTFILIFEKCFNTDTVDEIIETAVEVRDIQTDDYVISVFRGVYENLEEIDSIISKNLSNWSIDRISRVSLAILRLAVYEMKYEENIPVSVSINEAVELAKVYAAQNDAPFINGVLGTIASSVKE